jgi:hypothetical protein
MLARIPQPIESRSRSQRHRVSTETAVRPSRRGRPVGIQGWPHLIRLAKFPNVVDRKRVLARHASEELAPLRRANAGAFHGRFGALNDFVDWLAVRDRYKHVWISRH